MKNGRMQLLVLAILSMSLTAPAIAQEGLGIEFLAMPKPGPSEHDGYFMFDAARGETVTQRLLLRNDTAHPLKLRLEPLDAGTALYGGVDYGLAGEKVEAVGTWIELRRSQIRLAPGAGAAVAFDVHVPADALAGHNLAGIGIYPVGDEKGDQGQATEGTSAEIIVVQRRVVAVQVNVPGGTSPRLEIQSVTPSARADGVYLGVEISASGGALTKGSGTIRIFDEEGFEQDFTLETIVPGTEIIYPIFWRDSASNGEYSAEVEIAYDDGRKLAEWSGTFAIGDGLQADLSDKGGRAQQGGIPIPAVIGVILTIALLAWWSRRRIRPLHSPVVVPLKLRPAPPVPHRTAPLPPPPAPPSPAIAATSDGAPQLAPYRAQVASYRNGHSHLVRRVNGKESLPTWSPPLPVVTKHQRAG